MRKLWLMLFLMGIAAAVGLLTACAQATSTPTPQVLKPVATENPEPVKMVCQVVSVKPTLGPTEVSMFPPPSKDEWILGENQDALMTIIEYSDFQ
jgi:hypothetical protein